MRGAGSSLMSSYIGTGCAFCIGYTLFSTGFCTYQVVPDDVGFLQKQAHVVGELGAGGQLGRFAAARSKQLTEADAYQAGHVVAVEVIVLHGLHLRMWMSVVVGCTGTWWRSCLYAVVPVFAAVFAAVFAHVR